MFDQALGVFEVSARELVGHAEEGLVLSFSLDMSVGRQDI